MSWNITYITESNSSLRWFQNVNDLSDGVIGNGFGLLGNGIFVAINIILLLLGMKIYYDMKKAMLGAGFISMLIGFVMYAMGILNSVVLLLSLVEVLLGIILSQREDNE